MSSLPSGDEDLLRQRLSAAAARGEVISGETAQAIATWFARAIGPGFRTFLASGLVTPQFYRELTYLYDQRQPEVANWLDALVRYSLWQPTIDPGDVVSDQQPGDHS
jgi:hypothetical protein